MNQLIEHLKENGQDHEFYPTTNEIIAKLVRDVKTYEHSGNRRYDRINHNSVLDIGAGTGKVLEALKRADLGFHSFYAIEKSSILCGQLPEDFMVVGTAFEEQSLLSKEVDVIFSNPPYSVFVEWTCKIIRESAAPLVYLVIPQRWEGNEEIARALKFRGAKAKSLGDFDFLNSEDREARAKVQLLRVVLPGQSDDAFEAFFNEEFADLRARFGDEGKHKQAGEAPDKSKEREHQFAGLVVGENYPEAMARMYQDEMAKIQRNYQNVAALDAELLREFGVYPATICACLKKRLSDLRMAYWNELFSKLTSLTDRLTVGSRKSLLGTLQKHVHVDFTVSNIQVVVIWAIRNANRFIESQLVSVYENMVASCNVVCYKSNQRTFKENGWRYLHSRDGWERFALDYRIVCHSVGGINCDPYGDWQKKEYNGLREEAFHFLRDLLTIANNLGFLCSTRQYPVNSGGCRWESNQGHEFFYKAKDGTERELFQARAFQNGNLHLKLSKQFILALNVEHGRLRGWLRDKAEAVTELQDKGAGAFFGCTVKLLPDAGFAKLGAPAPSDEPAAEVEKEAPKVRAANAAAPVVPAPVADYGVSGPERLGYVVGLQKCHRDFQATMRRIAEVAKLPAWRVFQFWKRYSDECASGDQSAVLGEFIQWYEAHLGTASNRERLQAALVEPAASVDLFQLVA